VTEHAAAAFSGINGEKCEWGYVSNLLKTSVARGVDPYGTGGTCPPNIYEGGHPW